jgi:hypothetical protein
METKKEYTAPELTVVSFKTERGYAASNPLAALSVLSTLIGLNTGSMETWSFDENDNTFDDNTIDWS